MSSYDIAQVCPNGHIANEQTQASPQHNQDYCKKCGGKTMTACPSCNHPIRGYYHRDGVVDLTGRKIDLPAYCTQCGSPYPWTESALGVAIEIAQEAENLSVEERELLVASIPDVMVDNQKTSLAASRFKRLIAKAGSSTFELLYKWSIDFASETAVKLIKEGK